jgi:gluconokinase
VSARPDGAPAEVIIGVDVGTTAAKVSAFGIGSPWRRTAVREYPLLRPRPGREVQQPDVLVDAVLAALAETVAGCDGATVLALALSSAMHGLIGLDEQHRPLTPLITWADSRAADEAAQLRREGPARALLERSGTPVHSMSPLTKLIWFRRNEPELFARVRRWVGLKDWVVLSLTGVLATELSSASGSGLLELTTGTWSAASLDLAGIDESRLPPVLATTAVLDLADALAGRLGLPAGLPVVLGAGDGPLGNLGSGAIDPGVAGLSLGTSGAIRALAPRSHLDRAGGLFRYALTDQDWVVGGAISNGGSVLRWAGGVFGGDAAAPGPDDAAVLRSAASIPAGCDGLVALPYLMAERAPLWTRP